MSAMKAVAFVSLLAGLAAGPLQICSVYSVHLLHGRAAGTARCGTATAAKAAARHATFGHATAAARRLVDLHHDGVHDTLELLLLGLELVFLSQLVFVKPVKGLLHRLFNLFLVPALELVLELLLVEGVAHREAIILQAILGLNLRLIRFILGPELLGLLHHTVDLGLREPALLIRDGDLV